MLASLFVKDFAIVGEAQIEFRSGLTVVTGETGAGKSLLVDALLLLAGGRADAGSVRHGCERAELVAEFDLTDAAIAREWLRNEELDDDGQCQLRRVIRAEGSSKSYINGRPVTLNQLGALGEKLIEIHGQHEHQALLDRSNQLGLLDAFGAHPGVLERVADVAERWRAVNREIGALGDGDDPGERIALLEHQFRELDTHALSEVELTALNETHKRLANAGHLVQGTAHVGELLDGDSEFAATRALARSHGEIGRLAELDPRLAPISELLDSAQIQLSEASAALGRYRDALDLDPDRLGEIESQLAKLHDLGRKHRVPMGELKARAEQVREELEALRGAGKRRIELDAERTRLKREYQTAADQLTAARTKAMKKLGNEVSALMSDLGMAGGRFEVALQAQEKSDPDPQGQERCEFMVSANPGQPPRALRKVASGGELSRISLAIEVAALGLDDVGCMVFDEVDAGIGGAVAEVVGQKLRRLGSSRQVLCVTHLAQVAAQGHQHLLVAKSTSGKTTQTSIENLVEKSRREELARMLGGIDITKETLAHAKQMLQRAQSTLD